jgi:hypothetical protein
LLFRKAAATDEETAPMQNAAKALRVFGAFGVSGVSRVLA